MEKTVDIFAKRDFKRKNLVTTLGAKRSAKDLRAKSIASTLERVRQSRPKSAMKRDHVLKSCR